MTMAGWPLLHGRSRGHGLGRINNLLLHISWTCNLHRVIIGRGETGWRRMGSLISGTKFNTPHVLCIGKYVNLLIFKNES